MERNRLFLIGAIVLAIGAVTSAIGSIGELGYYQCISASGVPCTTNGNNQYITVLLANSDIVSISLSVALIGAIILIGGSITSHVRRMADQVKTSMNPLRVCPKCGVQVAGTAKFCASCGNKLGE